MENLSKVAEIELIKTEIDKQTTSYSQQMELLTRKLKIAKREIKDTESEYYSYLTLSLIPQIEQEIDELNRKAKSLAYEYMVFEYIKRELKEKK
ncbi:hypothetical protein [Rummeliibacillus pycnus]|uniref:hypothetical protein n=1 Tax=Rummeliibacillus pycnus TaxID=101070 RepID=UPI000C9AEA8F|nr:hypothetical protein [Rummeliibacillus pycnus]